MLCLYRYDVGANGDDKGPLNPLFLTLDLTSYSHLIKKAIPHHVPRSCFLDIPNSTKLMFLQKTRADKCSRFV